MDETKFQEEMMRRCLQIAEISRGKTATNPMVGAVIVHDHKIIAEGFHKKFGAEHAEIDAFNNLNKEDFHKLKDTQMYISLEPCFHHGKTPPCVNKILAYKIPEVFIALEDPNPIVNGKSIALMRDHGVKVHVGILKEEAENLLKIFKVNVTLQRPYVYLKFAQSADGFIAKPDERTRISDQYSNRLVHKWRSEVDAIMVGTNTAIIDDPNLTTRDFSGKSPIRVIIDKSNKVPSNYHIFDGTTKTIIFTNKEKATSIPNLTYIVIQDEGDEIQQMLKALFNRNVGCLLVEGGALLLQSFVNANLWDEARIITNPQLLKEGIKAPSINGNLVATKELVRDRLSLLVNPKLS